MASSQSSQQRIGDFYAEVVLPALAARLDTAFPEFGWKRDARGWVATNEEMTHRVLGVRAERVVAHGSAPPGFLVHGGDVHALDGLPQRRRGSARRDVPGRRRGARGARRGRLAPIERAPATRSSGRAACRTSSRSVRPSCAAAQATRRASYLESRGFPPGAIDDVGLGVVPDELLTKNALQGGGLLGARDRAVRRARRRPMARAALRSLARRARTDRNVLGAVASRLRLVDPLPLPPRREPHRSAALRPRLSVLRLPPPTGASSFSSKV